MSILIEEELEVSPLKEVHCDAIAAFDMSASVCGYKNENLRLSERDWTCPECGTYYHRDKNASTNIKKEGIRLLEERGITVIS